MLVAMRIDGSMPGPVFVGAGSTLGGNGSVEGPVTIDWPATFSPELLFSTGNLLMKTGASLQIRVDGPGPGTGHASVNVNGTASIAGATLALSGGYQPGPGDVFTVLVNDGVDPIIGTFAGLPEGATFTFNSVPLRISYVGGSGNDVTLTSLAGLADPHQVPTLSEWGFMILTMLVMAIGMLRGRKA